ncbi:APC family permease [Candidatus Allofournierella excrementavium]|uniref:APC family permease n=1 Tax=Candidatus Allofournierella excrementavium TaxID=2838591 RepID=UPI003A882C73
MSEKKTELKREMGLFSSVCVLVGCVIGSGIFTTPGNIAASAGSFGPNMLAWVIAGVSGVLCALVYAELAPAMPKAGGAYVYIDEAFGHGASFMYGWSMIFGNFLAVIAMMATAFASNFAVLFPGLNLSVTEQRIVATVLILGLSFVNVLGVKSGSAVQNIFTVAKVGVLLVVIVGGLFNLSGENFTTTTTETVEWGNSFSAAVPALTAFGGYYTLSYMSGEIKNPKRTLPLATIIGMGIVIIINALLTIACVGTVGFANLAGSATPVSDAAQQIFGGVGAMLVTLGAMISIFGSTNGALLGMPRVAYAMADNHMMFPFFAKLHPKFKTPYITIIIYAVVAICFVWTGNFMTLLMMGTFVSRLGEVAICISLIVLRKKQPALERPFKMWGYPITTILAAIITFILVCHVAPQQILSGSLLMLTSVPAYLIFRATVGKKAASASEKE